LPQKIFCKNCGTILYSGEELESPINIIQKYNSLCPNCKKKLNFDPSNIRIHSIEIKKPKSIKSKKVRG